jgi:hypothetical protein
MRIHWYQPKSGLVVTISLEFLVFGTDELAKRWPRWLQKAKKDARPATKFACTLQYN